MLANSISAIETESSRAFAQRGLAAEHREHRSPAQVDLFVDDKDALRAQITTENLYLESINSDPIHARRYCELFGSPQIMSMYAGGKTYPAASVVPMVEGWADRWKRNDPFSSLSVHCATTDEFIGNIILGHSGKPGQADLSGLSRPDFWGKSFGFESSDAIVHDFAPELVRRNYLLEGEPFAQIYATARPENVASWRILQKIGFEKTGELEKFGARRFEFLFRL